MPPTDTLNIARAWLRDRLADGAACPCCTQHAQLYYRVITSTMAADLIVCHRAAGTDWFHMPTVLRLNGRATGGDTAKARYWGLIEPHPPAPNGATVGQGWWRFTAEGDAYVHARHSVPKTAAIYDGRCLNLSGPLTDIRHALHTRFDYRKLMNGEWGPP